MNLVLLQFEELAKNLEQVAAESMVLLEGDDAIAPEQDDVDLQLIDPDDCVPYDYIPDESWKQDDYKYCYEEDIDLSC